MSASISSSSSASADASAELYSASKEDLTPFLFQIFAAHGCLTDAALATHLKTLTGTEWSNNRLRDLFVSVNAQMRDFGFEIRTVLLRDYSFNSSSSSSSSSSASSNFVQFHSMVNIEEDHVAREVGSVFSAEELQLFTKTLERLLLCKKMTTADILEVCQEHVTSSERRKHSFLQDLVRRWEKLQWLVRSEAQNVLLIGPRTHIELRHLLESYAEQAMDEDEASTTSTTAQQSLLPQIILHG
jgi:SpoVK/Ycf46/Vps4 family AAA+-type ATPase